MLNNKTKSKKQYRKKINETMGQLFEKLFLNNKPLVRLVEEKRDKTQIVKVRKIRGDITNDVQK